MSAARRRARVCPSIGSPSYDGSPAASRPVSSPSRRGPHARRLPQAYRVTNPAESAHRGRQRTGRTPRGPVAPVPGPPGTGSCPQRSSPSTEPWANVTQADRVMDGPNSRHAPRRDNTWNAAHGPYETSPARTVPAALSRARICGPDPAAGPRGHRRERVGCLMGCDTSVTADAGHHAAVDMTGAWRTAGTRYEPSANEGDLGPGTATPTHTGARRSRRPRRATRPLSRSPTGSFSRACSATCVALSATTRRTWRPTPGWR